MSFRYLLVTHIPFTRDESGSAVVDSLWARDLEGLAASVGSVRVAAPQLSGPSALQTWGPSAAKMDPQGLVTFAGFPAINSRRDLWRWPQIWARLRDEVAKADLVHTSNGFPPYLGLSQAHDLAVRAGKKTLFVIAEDFYDMLDWEWVRTASSGQEQNRRAAQLNRLDQRARRSAATATLTFLHTPAAVERYRSSARNGVAIRQPGHEAADVVAESVLAERQLTASSGRPLVIVTACRHKPLKGLDFLIRSIALLKAQGVDAEARLYGQGESTENLRSLACRLGVADRINFPGSLPPGTAVYSAISQGDLFAMPHRTTDFGRAFFDAMAGGTPVVAFRTPASQGTVRDGVDGLLTPMDDVESLAAGIRRFHDDRRFLAQASEAARQRAHRNTRSIWYDLRAQMIHSLFSGGAQS